MAHEVKSNGANPPPLLHAAIDLTQGGGPTGSPETHDTLEVQRPAQVEPMGIFESLADCFSQILHCIFGFGKCLVALVNIFIGRCWRGESLDDLVRAEIRGEALPNNSREEIERVINSWKELAFIQNIEKPCKFHGVIKIYSAAEPNRERFSYTFGRHYYLDQQVIPTDFREQVDSYIRRIWLDFTEEFNPRDEVLLYLIATHRKPDDEGFTLITYEWRNGRPSEGNDLVQEVDRAAIDRLCSTHRALRGQTSGDVTP